MLKVYVFLMMGWEDWFVICNFIMFRISRFNFKYNKIISCKLIFLFCYEIKYVYLILGYEFYKVRRGFFVYYFYMFILIVKYLVKVKNILVKELIYVYSIFNNIMFVECLF